MQKWLSDKDAIQKELLADLSQIPPDHIATVSKLFYAYIMKSLESSEFLQATLQYTFTVSLIFFMRLSPAVFPSSDAPRLKKIFERVPFMPVCHEFSCDMTKIANELEMFSKSPIPKASRRFSRDVVAIQKWFSVRSAAFHHLATSDQPGATVISTCVESLRLISSTTASLRELYAGKLAAPEAEPSAMKPYERAVRTGFKPVELKAMLQLLALCREFHDLIRSDLATVYPKLTAAIHGDLQNVVKNVLEQAHVRAKHQKAALRVILDQIRAVGGGGSPEESPGTAARRAATLRKQPVAQRSLVPSPNQIQVVRIQLQHVLNPESTFMQDTGKFRRGGKSLHEADEAALFEFLGSSLHYIDLLKFEEILAGAADQSAFYFKEVQLDLNSVVQFPVRTSLPFILCQYALDNYGQPDLTEIIFYPLSIYNDAAFVAQNVHKSRLMFDEIRAESRVCLETLSVLIGEFTFNAFRTFVTLNQLPDLTTKALKLAHARHWPLSQGYRLRTLIRQNQYFLLSQQVALISTIAARVDQELRDAVRLLYDVGCELGLVASVAIRRSVGIVRETHRLLTAEGLPMLPFVDIERAAKLDNSLTAFASKFAQASIKVLFKQIARRAALATDPLRLVPPKKVQLPYESFGKGALGRILKDALEGTVAFVSVCHFSAFIEQIGDGAIVILAHELRSHMDHSIARFRATYAKVCARLSRIKDSPFATSAHGAFTRFEAAYTFFLEDPEIADLLHDMQNIGNTIAIAELLDQAIVERNLSMSQMLHFLLQKADGFSADIEKLFDMDFRDVARILMTRCETAGNFEHAMLLLAIDAFCGGLSADLGLFLETAPSTGDFTALVGFAARWSVLEFVFGMMESQRAGDTVTGYARYGFGVMVCTSLVLLMTEQVQLSRLLGIGRRVKRHCETDMTGMVEERIMRFLAVSQLGMAALDWGLAYLGPYFEMWRKTVKITPPE
jgi:hypothetical protein